MSELEKLREARDLIARPGGWTQDQYARDEDGRPVAPNNVHATCFCAVGALQRVGTAGWSVRDLANTPLSKWNDQPGRTQAEVVALFDAAIAREQG